jgi:hypothetical protein
MKWSIYATAAALTAIATYRTAADSGFSTEGVLVWIGATLFGGALWGFIGNWVYNRWSKRAR